MEVANKEHVPFIDMNGVLGGELQEMGQEKAQALYQGTDTVHTNVVGARHFADVAAELLVLLPKSPVAGWLLHGPGEGGGVEVGAYLVVGLLSVQARRALERKSLFGRLAST